MKKLNFLHKTNLVSSTSRLYRPPSYPPPDDWPVSVDINGNELSYYGDNKWDYSAFGYSGYNFGKQGLDDKNLALAKQVMIFVLYHSSFYPGSYQGAKIYFNLIIKIAKICSINNVPMDEVSRFPKIFKQISDKIQCSKSKEYVSYLHKLLAYKDELGFTIADKNMISYLARNLSEHEVIQHPYIPPRLYVYQLNRLSECLDDFFKNEIKIIDAFNWILNAYEANQKVISTQGLRKGLLSPFINFDSYRNSRVIYQGNFEKFLKDFGLYELLEKWSVKSRISKNSSFTLNQFSKYLNLIRSVSVLYILNYSLQRRDEACSMRADCFSIEHDHKLGPIAMLSGETTKTDQDSDARWVTSKLVEKAVRAATSIANLRMKNAPDEIKKEVGGNHYLLTPAFEPWVLGTNYKESRIKYIEFGVLDALHPAFFDKKELLITEDDAKIALSLTPNLGSKDWFGIGKIWRFGAHQLRRTNCINMFASNMVSDSSIQFEMKHLSRLMSLYYGRNYTNLRLNSDVETQLIVESYKSIYRQFSEVIGNSYEYIKPHSRINVPIEIVNLVDEKDEKCFIDLAKRGEIGCRLTLLGLCLKRGVCEYGGIESVSKCVGSDGGNICSDAIFMRKNKDKLIKLRDSQLDEIKLVDIHSPRYKALDNEIRAIGIYLNVIERK